MNSELNDARKLNELALAAANFYLSEETNYLHYNYSLGNGEKLTQTIPIVENFLYILALLQSRTVENMMQAKTRLEAIYFFQNLEKNNFPTYLHEYPECKDKYLMVHLLPTLYYILQDFSSVIGDVLKQRLIENAKASLTQFLEQIESLPYLISLKVAAVAIAFSRIFEAEKLSVAKMHLEKLKNEKANTFWYQPAAIAEICLSLQLAYEKIINSPWQVFEEHLHSTWHYPTASYIGPAIKLAKQEQEPESSLYDLFLGMFSGRYSNRALKPAIFHLQAALIKPVEERIQIPTYPVSYKGKIESQDFTIYQTEEFAYSALNKEQKHDPSKEYLYHSFYLVFGDLSKVYTLVSQGGNQEKISFKVAGNVIEMTSVLSPVVDFDDRLKPREVVLFMDMDPDFTVTIGSEKATTFSVDDTCTIHAKNLTFLIKNQVQKGFAQILGHVMKGNRPSQKSQNKFNVYDWQIFLRTLRRDEDVEIKTVIEIHSS